MAQSPGIIDIIVPVYNEDKSIRQAITAIVQDVTIPYRLNLVYDRDDDTTLPVARAVAKELGVEIGLIKNAYGRGALNAIKTGLNQTQGEFAVVTMADLSDPPSVINAMHANAVEQKSDIVCGSRYMRGGAQRGGPLLKRLMSRGAGVSLRYLVRFPTHDVTNSFKLYRRRVLQAIQIESQGGFELGMEIVVKAYHMGFKVTEVPTSWQDRSEGQSRFQLWNWLPHYLKWYFLGMGYGAMRLVTFAKDSS